MPDRGENMTDKVLDNEGNLLPKFTPAIYFDSCVLIDYYLAYGLEFEPSPIVEAMGKNRAPYEKSLLTLFKQDKRFADLTKLRETLLNETDAYAVTSPLAIFELIGWNSATTFKDIAVDLLGSSSVLKKGNKDIARLLGHIVNEHIKESERLDGVPWSVTTGKDGERQSTGERSWGSLFSITSTSGGPSLRCHELFSIIVADVINFKLAESDVWCNLEILSYLQMGAADILHLLIARHLGCKWFATFDSDFTVPHCKKYIEEELGLSLLTTPQDIINELKRHQ